MTIRLPAEWEEQDAVLLAWPHEETDWRPRLATVQKTFTDILSHILAFEKAVVIAPDLPNLRRDLDGWPIPHRDLILHEVPTNDTWARDFGPVIPLHDGRPVVIDFQFNGWGGKFPASHDNRVTAALWHQGLFKTSSLIRPGLVLEGGSIDSDGQGTLLTTERCLLNPNRNPQLTRPELEERLSGLLGVKRFLWLSRGFLAGDDTDSHVDILARFCSPTTIAYSSCDNEKDDHFLELTRMAEELAAFRTLQGEPYRLIPLPLPAPRFGDSGQRLAAGYANFLLVNRAVLVPVYADPHDDIALERLRDAVPGREVIPVDCRELIRQGGSLHCLTMQLPKGVLA